MVRRVHETVEIQAPVEDIFRYWSNFSRIVERGELGGPERQAPSR